MISTQVSIAVMSFLLGGIAGVMAYNYWKPKIEAVGKISQGKDGKWRYEIENKDGRTLAVSSVKGYVSKSGAVAALRELEQVTEVGIARG